MKNVMEEILRFNYLDTTELRQCVARLNCKCFPCLIMCEDCIFDNTSNHQYGWVCNEWAGNNINKMKFTDDEDFFIRVIE